MSDQIKFRRTGALVATESIADALKTQLLEILRSLNWLPEKEGSVELHLDKDGTLRKVKSIDVKNIK